MLLVCILYDFSFIFLGLWEKVPQNPCISVCDFPRILNISDLIKRNFRAKLIWKPQMQENCCQKSYREDIPFRAFACIDTSYTTFYSRYKIINILFCYFLWHISQLTFFVINSIREYFKEMPVPRWLPRADQK